MDNIYMVKSISSCMEDKISSDILLFKNKERAEVEFKKQVMQELDIASYSINSNSCTIEIDTEEMFYMYDNEGMWEVEVKLEEIEIH